MSEWGLLHPGMLRSLDIRALADLRTMRPFCSPSAGGRPASHIDARCASPNPRCVDRFARGLPAPAAVTADPRRKVGHLALATKPAAPSSGRPASPLVGDYFIVPMGVASAPWLSVINLERRDTRSTARIAVAQRAGGRSRPYSYDVRRLGREGRVTRRRTSPAGPLPSGWERRRFSGNGSGRSSSCLDLAQKSAEASDGITTERRHRMLASVAGAGGFPPSSANPEARDPPAARRHLSAPLAGAVRRKAQPGSTPRQRQLDFRRVGPAGPVFTPSGKSPNLSRVAGRM